MTSAPPPPPDADQTIQPQPVKIPAKTIIIGIVTLVVLSGTFAAGMAFENNRIKNNIEEAFSDFGEEIGEEGEAETSDQEDLFGAGDDSDDAKVKELAFGETHEWEDGISLTVGVPAPYQPSEYASVGEAPAYLAFDVTIVNGSDEPFDASMVYSTLQSGNAESEEVYDSGAGVGNSPETTLLPGREATYRIAYGVADPADLVMEWTLNTVEHEDIFFTS